jgi:RecJ-like exonuclease
MIIQQKCPICEGHGIVDGGFYNSTPGNQSISTNSSEICRNCNGTGVVYVKQEGEI